MFFWNIFSIWPAVLRQATYGTIKFGTYYTLKKVVTEKGWLIDKHGNERVWCNVLCAVTGKQFAFEMQTETEIFISNLFVALSFHSWCNKQRNCHTHRCAESSNASARTWYGPSGIDWLLPGNLSPWRNLRFMASMCRMRIAYCYFDLFSNYQSCIEFFFCFLFQLSLKKNNFNFSLKSLELFCMRYFCQFLLIISFGNEEAKTKWIK